MNENENITKWEDRFTEDKEEVANMDKDDFLNLLMEEQDHTGVLIKEIEQHPFIHRHRAEV